LPATFIQRLGGLLAARVQSLVERLPFAFLREATWAELNNCGDGKVIFDALPDSDVGKVCDILRTVGVFRENASVLELGAASGIQTMELATWRAACLSTWSFPRNSITGIRESSLLRYLATYYRRCGTYRPVL
jgi:hypothetical protein